MEANAGSVREPSNGERELERGSRVGWERRPWRVARPGRIGCPVVVLVEVMEAGGAREAPSTAYPILPVVSAHPTQCSFPWSF